MWSFPCLLRNELLFGLLSKGMYDPNRLQKMSNMNFTETHCAFLNKLDQPEISYSHYNLASVFPELFIFTWVGKLVYGSMLIINHTKTFYVMLYSFTLKIPHKMNTNINRSFTKQDTSKNMSYHGYLLNFSCFLTLLILWVWYAMSRKLQVCKFSVTCKLHLHCVKQWCLCPYTIHLQIKCIWKMTPVLQSKT